MDSIFHRLFLASLSQIVSARFVTFVYQWWRVRSARGCLYISESNVSVHPRRTLCAVRVQRLVRCDFHWLFSFIKVVMMPNRAIASSRMPIKVAPRYGLRFSSVPGNEISISCRIKPDAGVPCRSDLPISLKMMKPANPANTAIIPLAMI